jgi:hypothetical protein
MSASAAATELARAPLEKSAFYLADSSTDVTPGDDKNGRTWQVKQVLRQAGFSMSRVSALTGMRYGKKTPFFVPPTFLHKQKNGITPHICQIVALSQVTGYRFVDWMNLCGFDLNLILALQLRVHTERTTIVTPTHRAVARDIRLMPRFLRLENSGGRYLFAKIGSLDNVVCPEILPGSVVRADRCYSPHIRETAPAENLLWLVEHPGGLACCHVKRVDNDHIVLLPNRPPLSAWPLRLSREARILGLIDLELRPTQAERFEPRYLPVKSATMAMVPRGMSQTSFCRLLRVSRSRAGLTLRAAHKLTLRVAQLLQNRDYGIPLGLLSDYEAMNRFPRHIAKIMSLCVVYGIDFWDLMEAGGSHIDDSDKMPILAPAA